MTYATHKNTASSTILALTLSTAALSMTGGAVHAGNITEPGELGYRVGCSIHELANTGHHCPEYQEVHDLLEGTNSKEYWPEDYDFNNPFIDDTFNKTSICDPVYNPSSCKGPEKGVLPAEEQAEIDELHKLRGEIGDIGTYDSSDIRPEFYVPSEVLMRDGSFTRNQIFENQERLGMMVEYHDRTGEWPTDMLDAGYHPDAVKEALIQAHDIEYYSQLGDERRAGNAAEQAILDEQEKIINFRVNEENKRSEVSQVDIDTALDEDRLPDFWDDEEGVQNPGEDREGGVTEDGYNGSHSDDGFDTGYSDDGNDGESSDSGDSSYENDYSGDGYEGESLDSGEIGYDSDYSGDGYEGESSDSGEIGYDNDYSDGGDENESSDGGKSGSGRDYSGEGQSGEGSGGDQDRNGRFTETTGEGRSGGGKAYDPQGHGPDGDGDPWQMSDDELRNWASHDGDAGSEGEQFAQIWNAERARQGRANATSVSSRDTQAQVFFGTVNDPEPDEVSGCSQADAERFVARATGALGPQPHGAGAAANYTLKFMKTSRDATSRFHNRCQRSDMSEAVRWWDNEIYKFQTWMRTAGIPVRH